MRGCGWGNLVSLECLIGVKSGLNWAVLGGPCCKATGSVEEDTFSFKLHKAHRKVVVDKNGYNLLST